MMHPPRRVYKFVVQSLKMKEERKTKKGPKVSGDQKDENHIRSVKNHLKHRSKALMKIIKYFKDVNNNSSF